MPDKAEALRRIRDAITAIPPTLDPAEQHRQLEIHQRRVVRLLEPGGFGEELPRWESLARKLERDHPELPRVDDIRDGEATLPGAERVVNVSPPERIGAWIEHAVAVIDCLVGDAPRGPSGRRKGRPADTDPRRDARCDNVWMTGGYHTIAEAAASLGMPEADFRAARERHRKRKNSLSS